MADFYYDDPVEESKGTRKNFKGVLALILLIVAGGTYLQTTLAANISLNSGRSVEFGQGVAMAAACSGANSLTVTPNSEFVNASGSGAYYLKSITVSGIPAECNGDDFQISVYDSATSTALPMFASTKTVASIWNNGGNFQGGSGFLGSTITSSSGSFTVSFTTPVALASNVAKLTLQSTNHVAGDCITESLCSLGDIGPGGGMVFYAGAPFTMTGATCNTNCRYLEWAPVSWASTQSQNASFSEPGTATTDARTTIMPGNALLGTSDSFGSGLSNTRLFVNAASSGTSATNGAKAVQLYAGNDSSAGQWFLPSRAEAIALQQSSVLNRGGFTLDNNHWTSSEDQSVFNFQIILRTGVVSRESRGNYKTIRPIRAF
jgi:hypothetical protein